jgi:hypothetical protein
MTVTKDDLYRHKIEDIVEKYFNNNSKRSYRTFEIIVEIEN